jgi:hypothetical protein
MQDLLDILPTAKAGGFPLSRAGFPASSRLAWIGFHRSGSYSLSTGIDCESHSKDIVCCIDVSIMVNTTPEKNPAFRKKVAR